MLFEFPLPLFTQSVIMPMSCLVNFAGSLATQTNSLPSNLKYGLAGEVCAASGKLINVSSV